ncbi:uncharacterized protein LOC125179174 [Hyalella azteca]|uniref:Uncharacterized protein LOC125179174 n=1 Tax=Hyalella azteca TaxID=294128 RepID=A0A979FW01_HYAAZ|nr:uncharacterized protein LOC125179174 [Hyalella azteca]
MDSEHGIIGLASYIGVDAFTNTASGPWVKEHEVLKRLQTSIFRNLEINHNATKHHRYLKTVETKVLTEMAHILTEALTHPKYTLISSMNTILIELLSEEILSSEEEEMVRVTQELQSAEKFVEAAQAIIRIVSSIPQECYPNLNNDLTIFQECMKTLIEDCDYDDEMRAFIFTSGDRMADILASVENLFRNVLPPASWHEPVPNVDNLIDLLPAGVTTRRLKKRTSTHQHYGGANKKMRL